MGELAVVAQSLKKTYQRGGEPFWAVDDISFEIPAAGIYGLLGPNGAGKSTTLEMIAGLRKPDGGAVRVHGLDPFRDRAAITHRLSIQPQKAAVFQHQTVIELLSTWALFYPQARTARDIIDALALGPSASARVAKLSGGQLQRLLIGTAIISSPDVLILDEPSAGLDPNSRDDLWSAIRAEGERGATVILSTHSMEEAEALCESLTILNEGKIVANGSPHALISEHASGNVISFDMSSSRLDAFEANTELRELMASCSRKDQGAFSEVTVETTQAERFLKCLMSSNLAADVQNLTTTNAGLDSVFKKVTGRALEDD
ncbi:ABC transporter ATP-binding protein [Brevibacterium sp. HMSC07C04]|uniref:ABC transporter ATP-binding protein n=1 Tax=Brevibacterium sp. HMSC07C04 TaxID=1581130 RepID=UPI0008A64297|nr:ABC transporter ATP-binding protein [Brevibacterium sp. HMSC07C04]OFS27797.1 hypothetical protein HMPREF3162_00955 [Brevibacterium sp. HMSC07C04]